jgi:polygalacturonase
MVTFDQLVKISHVKSSIPVEINPQNFSFDIILWLLQCAVRRHRRRRTMFAEPTGRRSFLKLTVAGIAGSALGTAATVQTASAKANSTNGGTLDVRTFGAAGDGKTLDTPAINNAIQTAAATGGGIVRFPAGNYLCYSIHLKSHITLSLDPGATIVAADAPGAGASGGYDSPEPNSWDKFQDFGHSHWHNSLIWGEDLENVSIEGQGLIWGKGLSRGDHDVALAAGVGNKSISLKNCRNVTIRDISILHGGHFAILATGVDNLTIDNLKIDTNRDAIDIDCCRNVRVSNCSVNSPWDDGICLKDSYGLGFARSTDHVTITNCYVTGGYEEGTMLDASYKRFAPDFKVPRNGRIKFGTESNGGFRNITVSNCVIENCRGIAIESVDGAIVEDIAINNITMRDIVDVPLFLRLGSRMRGPEGTPVGELRRVFISDVIVSNCASRQATIIAGIPGHYIEDVRLSNILVLHQGGGSREDAAVQPPELENAYPDPNRFGTMPAHGFYIRHVKRIEIKDVEVRPMNPDMRPGFVLDDVNGAEFIHVKLPNTPEIPSVALKNVKNFSVTQSKPLSDTQVESAEQKTLL